MKNTYIFIDSEGSPVYSASNFTDDGFYVNGNTYGNYTCIEYDGVIHAEDIVALYYYNDIEFLIKPERPSFNHKWTRLNGWQDTRSLQDVKDTKHTYVNSARSKANNISFSYLGKDISVDRLSRGDIDAVNGYITLTGEYPVGWPGGWKCIDNTYVALTTVTDWVSFYSAMVGQGTANFAHSQDLKALINAATTKEEVEAITW